MWYFKRQSLCDVRNRAICSHQKQCNPRHGIKHGLIAFLVWLELAASIQMHRHRQIFHRRSVKTISDAFLMTREWKLTGSRRALLDPFACRVRGCVPVSLCENGNFVCLVVVRVGAFLGGLFARAGAVLALARDAGVFLVPTNRL